MEQKAAKRSGQRRAERGGDTESASRTCETASKGARALWLSTLAYDRVDEGGKEAGGSERVRRDARQSHPQHVRISRSHARTIKQTMVKHATTLTSPQWETPRGRGSIRERLLRLPIVLIPQSIHDFEIHVRHCASARAVHHKQPL